MFEIKQLKQKILIVLDGLEKTKNVNQRSELIERLIMLRNLLNGLEMQMTHMKEIQLNMGMD